MTSHRTTGLVGTTALLFLTGVLVSATLDAAPSITFDQVSKFGGTVAYPVLGGTLTGKDIIFERIIAEGTLADDVYDCQTCRLDFVSGPNVAPGPFFYQWGAGGSFVLRGGSVLMGIDPGYVDDTCDDDADDSDCIPTTVLLSGSFTALPPNIGAGGGGTFNFISNGVDDKNAEMAAFLGINPLDWIYSESNLSSGTVNFNSDGTFDPSVVTQADITNRLPEPGSALLLLLGLGSLAAYRRRKN